MMLDLDNLDLELDEDFVTGPNEKCNLFESSFVGSLSWTGNKSNENLSHSDSKTVNNQNLKNTPIKNAANDPILKLLESTEKKPQNALKEDYNLFRASSCDILNESFSPSKLFDNVKNVINKSNDTEKRILTHRKFPGPAGLLPDKPLEDLSEIGVIVENSSENISAGRQKEAVILCSQTSSVYEEASFKKLASDFDLCKENCPLSKFTVDWVKRGAIKKTLLGKKIPFLAVVLHYLDHGTPDPAITLRDQTGEIYGTLHREVWSELGGKLQPGAALALRQVGVLITGIARRQVHLNITSNNIINIYSYTSEENVETSHINKVDKCDLFKSVNEWYCSISSAEPKTPSNPFTKIGDKKSCPAKNPSFKCRSSYKTPTPKIRDFSKNNSNQQNRTLMIENPSNSKGVESKNYINFMTSMEDDMTDFLASLGETDLDDSILGGKEDSNTNKECDNNNRKRKIVAEDVYSLNKTRCPVIGGDIPNSSGCGPPAKKVEYEEKYNLANKPLSQAESQIVEEVLDGIDFDDF